jgi:hypothetical protein
MNPLSITRAKLQALDLTHVTFGKEYHGVQSICGVTKYAGRYVAWPRAVIGVTIVGPTGSRARDAVLDTAADDTIFSDFLAATIGVDLSNAPSGTASGVGPATFPFGTRRFACVWTDGVEQRDWPCWDGFTPVRIPYPMLSFAGCLQFFTATFHGDREEVELAVNGSYTGT